MEDIEEKFREVLIKVFGYSEEEAENYVKDSDKWIDDNCIVLPNGPLLTYENGNFNITYTVADKEQFEEMFSNELSIDIENNKVAETTITLLMRRIASEIKSKTNFEATIEPTYKRGIYPNAEFLHVEKTVKNIEDIKKIFEKEFPKIEEIAKKLETYKCIYEYLTPTEIQKLFLSKVTYVAPVQIKRIGGSYGVIIPIDVLKMFINENVLKKGAEITAKLKANADSGEITLCEFECEK